MPTRRGQEAAGVALVLAGTVLLGLVAQQIPLEGARPAVLHQSDFAAWPDARSQQLADEAPAEAQEEGADGAGEGAAEKEGGVVVTYTEPYTKTVQTQSAVVPTMYEEIKRIEGLVAQTESKQVDEEAEMKTFREQQLNKIEALKDRNARLKRRYARLRREFERIGREQPPRGPRGPPGRPGPVGFAGKDGVPGLQVPCCDLLLLQSSCLAADQSPLSRICPVLTCFPSACPLGPPSRPGSGRHDGQARARGGDRRAWISGAAGA